MHSLASYVIPWIVWFRFRGSFQTPEALHARIKNERKTKTHEPPQRIRRQLSVEERTVGGYPVYDLSPKSEDLHRARLLYIHGGAFVFEIQPIHWTVVAELAERLNAIITVPIYPKGPEHSLPQMFDMLQPVHDEVAAAASRENVPFLMAGDSCGGSMALVLTQQASKAGKPIASRIVLNTPVVDCTLTNPDMYALAPSDPFHDMPGFEEIIKVVFSGMNLKDPMVSPIYGDLSILPPVLVFIAERDLLAPDTRRFVDMAREKGREVEVVEGEGMVHVWPVMPFPEGEQARRKMTQWLGKALSRTAEIPALHN